MRRAGDPISETFMGPQDCLEQSPSFSSFGLDQRVIKERRLHALGRDSHLRDISGTPRLPRTGAQRFLVRSKSTRYSRVTIACAGLGISSQKHFWDPKAASDRSPTLPRPCYANLRCKVQIHARPLQHASQLLLCLALACDQEVQIKYRWRATPLPSKCLRSANVVQTCSPPTVVRPC